MVCACYQSHQSEHEPNFLSHFTLCLTAVMISHLRPAILASDWWRAGHVNQC